MGDPHATPKADNNRFEVGGRFAVDRKPDVIVCAGDMASMDSLSSFDKGTRGFEGRRYVDDIDAVVDAQERFFKPINDYNRGRKKPYTPRLVMTLGNHEYRIERATQQAAELYGAIGIEDLKYEEFGWEVYPFKQIVNIGGINFVHYFPNGLMDKAISSVNVGRAILTKWHQSGFQGHSHILGWDSQTIADGRRMFAGSLGWFGDFREEYVSETVQRSWWSGLVMLNNVVDGDMDIETIRMETLKREYS